MPIASPGQGEADDRDGGGLVGPVVRRAVTVGPEGRAAEIVGDRELADDDRQGQERAAQQGHPQVREDDPDEDREPAGAEALGRLGQAADVDRPQARVDRPVHVRQRQDDIGADQQDVAADVGVVSGSGGRL